MGVIYSFESLRNRKIPSVTQLKEASKHAVKSLGSLIEQGLVASAMLYGSGPRGDGTRRSDIDALVRYTRVDALKPIKDLKQMIGMSFNGAVIDFCLIYDEFAATPFHREDTTFMQHLSVNPEHKIIIGANPLNDIWLPYGDVNPLTHNAKSIGFYLDGTARKFVEFDGEQAYIDFLKGAAERYRYIVREAVMMARDGKLPTEGNRTIDNNGGLAEYFGRDFSDHPDLVDRLNNLRDADKQHTIFVERTQEPGYNLSRDEFDVELSRLMSNFSVFMEFTIQVSRVLNERYIQQ